MGLSAPIKFAIAGYGRIGRRHATLIEEHPETRLCAIADINGSGHPGVPFFPSLEALISAPPSGGIDAVCIATPNGCHVSQACAALSSGLHVVVEKPLALSTLDAERIEAMADRTGRHVFTVMQNRYSAAARWLKTLIDAGRLGKIYMIQANAYWNRDDRYYQPGNWHGTRSMDGGVLFTQFSHIVDMLYWLVGDLSDIRARLGNFAHQTSTEFEDSGTAQFSFGQGGLGSFQFSTAVWDKNLESSITVIGETGSVRVAGQYMDHIEYCHLRDSFPEPDQAPANPADNHRKFFADVVDVLSGRADASMGIHDAVRVVDIIERIYKTSN